jgi:hypothetical protein
MAVSPKSARARTDEVLPLHSTSGNRVGELQKVNDRFGSYFRVLTGRKSECRTFYFAKDMTRWVSMLGLVIAH